MFYHCKLANGGMVINISIFAKEGLGYEAVVKSFIHVLLKLLDVSSWKGLVEFFFLIKFPYVLFFKDPASSKKLLPSMLSSMATSKVGDGYCVLFGET